MANEKDNDNDKWQRYSEDNLEEQSSCSFMGTLQFNSERSAWPLLIRNSLQRFFQKSTAACLAIDKETTGPRNPESCRHDWVATCFQTDKGPLLLFMKITMVMTNTGASPSVPRWKWYPALIAVELSTPPLEGAAYHTTGTRYVLTLQMTLASTRQRTLQIVWGKYKSSLMNT